MLRGFYTATSGMISQQRKQEMYANNIANANTPGYKSDQSTLRAFPEMLLQEMGTSANIPTSQGGLSFPVRNTIGSINTGVYVQETISDFRQGDPMETGNMTDVALVNGELPDENGFLFFEVQNDAGDVRYTRNGSFTEDGDGYLTTNHGLYVLDAAGNRIQTNGAGFTVNPDGAIMADGQVYQLGIAYAPDANLLVKEGMDLYAGDAGALPAGATYTVQQGFVERSNVDSTQTMADMMASYRLFEANQRVLKAYDESLGKAVTEIGRIG